MYGLWLRFGSVELVRNLKLMAIPLNCPLESAFFCRRLFNLKSYSFMAIIWGTKQFCQTVFISSKNCVRKP